MHELSDLLTTPSGGNHAKKHMTTKHGAARRDATISDRT